MFYKYIFCILVYRNTEDVLECINSIKKMVRDYRIIIINSFYDDSSKNIFEEIANTNGCDFINVDNKGYGYGNNRGFQHALENYKFDYIIVSNPDILIERFDEEYLQKYSDMVIAPMITTVKGKAQNPYWLFKNSFAERMIYWGQLKKNRFVLYSGYAINKMIREIGLFFFRKSKREELAIYAAHGSFCMFPRIVFDRLGLFYDENMFLFAEEAYVAHMLKKSEVKTILTKAIRITHKEDGSINLSKINENDESRKSFVYYYEKINTINDGV